jgi:hypothetical protein
MTARRSRTRRSPSKSLSLVRLDRWSRSFFFLWNPDLEFQRFVAPITAKAAGEFSPPSRSLLGRFCESRRCRGVGWCAGRPARSRE